MIVYDISGIGCYYEWQTLDEATEIFAMTALNVGWAEALWEIYGLRRPDPGFDIFVAMNRNLIEGK